MRHTKRIKNVANTQNFAVKWPDLNMLGAREPSIMAVFSLTSIEEKIQTLATQHNCKSGMFPSQ